MTTRNFSISKKYLLALLTPALLHVGALPLAAQMIDHTGNVEPTPEPSPWDVGAALYVGRTSVGTLTIQNGGEVSNTAGYIGYNSGVTGTVTVDGTGGEATWTNSAGLAVGNSGTGYLHITAGGQVDSSYSYLGFNSTATGTATVNGTGAAWNTSNSFMVGYSGTGYLSITAGGEVSNAGGFAGYYTNATGTIMVDGPNSTWNNSSNLYVGNDGKGYLHITAGGYVHNPTGNLGYRATATGTATVDGPGSIWANDGSLVVGNSGKGDLLITGGGRVISAMALVGSQAVGNGTVTVRGTNSTWNNTGAMEIGNYGTGSLHITAGGLVTSVNSYIGYQADSTGTVTVDGTGGGATWSNSSNLFVGNSGTGNLHITNGGQVNNTAGSIGYHANSNGSVTVDGEGSIWTNRSGLVVGNNGTGELRIKDLGKVSIGGNYSQNSASTLAMDIGSNSAGHLVVGGNVTLHGNLYLTVNGSLVGDYNILIENLGGNAINGTFDNIFFNGDLVDLTPIDGTLGGGSFVHDNVIYYLSYAGQLNGSLFDGNNLILGAVPEPASLAILGLGCATLLTRRRK
ncbi:MAG: PEP-CTERM sorting domain-containing protein [Phycisphaerales bacterium]|nr:PEP-CTERM sorting domain-containing protein [Phycisphaerales bacterium]